MGTWEEYPAGFCRIFSFCIREINIWPHYSRLPVANRRNSMLEAGQRTVFLFLALLTNKKPRQ